MIFLYSIGVMQNCCWAFSLILINNQPLGLRVYNLVWSTLWICLQVMMIIHSFEANTTWDVCLLEHSFVLLCISSNYFAMTSWSSVPDDGKIICWNMLQGCICILVNFRNCVRLTLVTEYNWTQKYLIQVIYEISFVNQVL